MYAVGKIVSKAVTLCHCQQANQPTPILLPHQTSHLWIYIYNVCTLQLYLSVMEYFKSSTFKLDAIPFTESRIFRYAYLLNSFSGFGWVLGYSFVYWQVTLFVIMSVIYCISYIKPVFIVHMSWSKKFKIIRRSFHFDFGMEF